MRWTLLLAALAAAIFAGCAAAPDTHDVIYQTSTINALLEGAYDGDVSVAELKARGDFGLGTFNALDGEMVALDGKFWQVRSDGRAREADETMKTPFAAVTTFAADRTGAVKGVGSLTDLTRQLDALVESKNLPWAVRVHATFSYVKTRSVPPQRRPYPKLVEVAERCIWAAPIW